MKMRDWLCCGLMWLKIVFTLAPVVMTIGWVVAEGSILRRFPSDARISAALLAQAGFRATLSRLADDSGDSPC
jgi:hypothetical protein